MDYFANYMATGFDAITGWPGNRPSVEFNRCLVKLFSIVKEPGGVCEIGVHHGKYLIALHNLFGDRKSLGFDLFDRQSANIDGSGKGDFETCRRNIEKYVEKPDLVSLQPANSLAFSSSDIDATISKFGKFSIFSIDGGHTKTHVCIDLDNATKMTGENGVIIVDDIFHPDWPEVTEGLYNSISTQRTPFVPFLITRKKLYLCISNNQQSYAKFANENRGRFKSKPVRFAGWELPSINFGSEY